MSSSEESRSLETGRHADGLSWFQRTRMGLAMLTEWNSGRTKRPASLRWLMFLSSAITLAAVGLLLETRTAEGMQRLMDLGWVFMVTVAMGPLLLVACLAGGRRWAYYLICGALTVVALRTLYVMVLFLWWQLTEKPSEWVTFICRELFCTGILWVWWRVVFGVPSRKYFGIGLMPENAEHKPL